MDFPEGEIFTLLEGSSILSLSALLMHNKIITEFTKEIIGTVSVILQQNKHLKFSFNMIKIRSD